MEFSFLLSEIERDTENIDHLIFMNFRLKEQSD